MDSIEGIIVKEGVKVQSGFKWPRMGSSGRFLYTQHWKFELCKWRDFLDNL